MITNKCDIMISRSCLKVKGVEIPCYISNGTQPICCRVVLVKSVSVAPESEVIVSGKPLENLDRSRLGLVEPSTNFVQKTGVLVAKVLVTPNVETFPFDWLILAMNQLR